MKTIRILMTTILTVVLVALSACAPQPTQPVSPTPETEMTQAPTTPPSIQPVDSLLQSKKPRLDPTAPQEDIQAVAAGNSAFAIDLYQKLHGTSGNLFFSPYSISLALAMTEAGAAGNTLTQMDSTMHYTLPQSKLHPAFNALSQNLVNRSPQVAQGEGDPFTFRIANAIWGQQDYTFRTEYLDLLAENYGAGMRLMNFTAAPEPSRKEINDWVARETEQKIKDLIPEGTIGSDTRLVLTNAIYFNAAWQYPFLMEQTSTGDFTNLDDTMVKVSQMHLSERLVHYAGDGYQMVELPYVGGSLVMDVIVPDAGNFAKVETSLTTEELSAAISKLAPAQVTLTMPKFSYDSSLELAKTLAELGMTDAFDPSAADFSGMDGTRNLVISDVIHKAFVSVNEAGTEAAAATAVVMKLTSMQGESITMTIDRPFIFVIRDIQTGTILFMGRVTSL